MATMQPAGNCAHQAMNLSRVEARLVAWCWPATPRLLEKFKREELIPLGSRIRTRLATEAATPEELRVCQDFVLAACGNANLMTKQLKHTLCDHAAGNYRVLSTLAGELLGAAAERELPQLDEQLYFQVFAKPAPQGKRSAASR